MRARVIVNPTANSGRARKQIPQIEQALATFGVAYELHVTERPKQATEWAASAAEAGFDAVLAAGGDGTIHEIVNGLIVAAGDGPTLPLGIFPVGTGNDLSDMINLPRDVAAAAKLITSGRWRSIDIGRVTIDGQSHYFDNNCAVAMEPLITAEYDQLTRLSGVPRYIAAVVKGLFKLRPWPMKLEWDDGSYEGNILLGSVCNGPRTGSTFLMSPDAKVDDGLFDFVFVPEIPMHLVLRLVPRITTGSHLKHPKVRHVQTRKLTVTSYKPTPVHADGELLTDGTSQVVYELLVGKLTLLG